MSKHTPGPWTAIPDDTAEADWCVVVEEGDETMLGLSEADAHLIAAAPDLLAALKDAARWIDTLPEDIRLGSIMPDKLRAAIAKAEGVR